MCVCGCVGVGVCVCVWVCVCVCVGWFEGAIVTSDGESGTLFGFF